MCKARELAAARAAADEVTAFQANVAPRVARSPTRGDGEPFVLLEERFNPQFYWIARKRRSFTKLAVTGIALFAFRAAVARAALLAAM